MAISSTAKNLDSVIFGSAEFSFAEGATSVTTANTIGYYDVGNVVSVQPVLEINQLDHFSGYRGCVKRDKKIITSSSLDWDLTLDNLTIGNLALGLAGSDATDYTASALASQAYVLNFSTITWGKNLWFDILDGSGNKIYNITSVTSVTHTAAATTLTEDTGDGTGDYEIDLTLGRIRFLTQRTEADVTITFNSAAVTSADDFFFNAITPLESGIRTGFGRLVVYECGPTNNIVIDHRDFKCQILPVELSEINGTNPAWGTIGLKVAVDASVPGTLYVRGSNN